MIYEILILVLLLFISVVLTLMNSKKEDIWSIMEFKNETNNEDNDN